MTGEQKAIVQECKRGAEDDTMTFPAIIGALVDADIEGYSVDFRRRAMTYYTANGDPGRS